MQENGLFGINMTLDADPARPVILENQSEKRTVRGKIPSEKQAKPEMMTSDKMPRVDISVPHSQRFPEADMMPSENSVVEKEVEL